MRKILTAKEQCELLLPWRKHADSDNMSLVSFFQWCADEHLKPNRAALERFTQVEGLDLEDFLNISRFLDGIGLDGDYLDYTRTARRFWGMADTTKWHPIIKHEPFGSSSGLYHITIPDNVSVTGKRIGDLAYTRSPKGKGHYVWGEDGRGTWEPRKNNEAYIDSLIVHPDYRGQGIAQALIERLYKDFPDHKINPGATTPEGHGFTQRMMETNPQSKDVVEPQWKPHILDDEDVEDYNRSELNRLVNARFWKNSMPAEDAYDPKPNQYQREQASMPLQENTSGKWYHVSPHKMEPGTILTPGGGKGPYPYQDSSVRPDWVWMDRPEGVKQWYYGTLMGQIQQGNENPWAYIYEVEPNEGPHPWNGSGSEGHVSPSARIVREIETDKYNRLPDHLGANSSQC